jgi:4-hydroxyphenylpyruvate dioxygenase
MTDAVKNPVPIKSVHHVELVVGNAKQAAYYYRKAFGFNQIAYLGPETGHRDRASYVLEQGKIRFVITAPMGADHSLAEHQKKHGDGVIDIACRVMDTDEAYQMAVSRGAASAVEPRTLEDDRGTVRHAAIRTYGDTIHSFYSLENYDGPHLPGYDPQVIEEESAGLWRIDHIVGNVEDHRMDHWVDWYRDVMGFTKFLSFDDKDISTEFTALRSTVMSAPHAALKMPINEPADGRKKSQIEEYIEFYDGPGVQHVALITDDIIKTVADLRQRGVEFLFVPDSYYETVWDRVGEVQEDRAEIQKHGILVDHDEQGYLLQLFTKPVEDRPTLFYEIIQRRGAQGFGKGNFKALFESIEREQEKRGNL